MAKKRKTKKGKSKLNPTIFTIGVLVMLLLGSLGIQLPEILQDYFDVSQPVVTKKEPAEGNKPPTSQVGDNPGPIDHGFATFTKKELADSTTGWIKYGELDGLERPTAANALLKKAMIGTGTKANRNLRPPGFISGLEPYGHSRGHLIGRQYGGSGEDLENLVTLYQTPVNSPLMTQYENQIRQALENNETIRFRVAPVYNEQDLMPIEIHMEAQSLNENGTINFNVSILNQK